MHGWQWQPHQYPGVPRWQDYNHEPAALDVPSSEQTWNYRSIGSALSLAHERIREQDEEIEQLRDMFQNGSRMNQYLLEEVEKLRRQLRQEEARRDDRKQQPPATKWTLQAQDYPYWSQAREESFPSDAYDVDYRSQPPEKPLPSVAFRIPSPRSLPTPFDSGEGSSHRELGDDIRVEDLPEEVPTRGSLGHPDNCKPCFYIFNKKGCHFGRSCLYCHMNHVRRKKERPPKLVRQECREIANKVFREAAPASGAASSSSHLEEALRNRLELARASHVTTNYAASVLRALERRTEDEAKEGEVKAEADSAA